MRIKKYIKIIFFYIYNYIMDYNQKYYKYKNKYLNLKNNNELNKLSYAKGGDGDADFPSEFLNEQLDFLRTSQNYLILRRQFSSLNDETETNYYIEGLEYFLKLQIIYLRLIRVSIILSGRLIKIK